MCDSSPLDFVQREVHFLLGDAQTCTADSSITADATPRNSGRSGKSIAGEVIGVTTSGILHGLIFCLVVFVFLFSLIHEKDEREMFAVE